MNGEIESNFLFVFLLQLLLTVAAAELGVGSPVHGCGCWCRQLGAFFVFLEKFFNPGSFTQD
jgi:hypothetical protein